MSIEEEVRRIRKQALLSQTEFAEAVGVSFATVNRWENGKGIPRVSAMKSIKTFCREQGISYDQLQKEWCELASEEKRN